MMNPRIYILNHATGEEIEREMTDEEYADLLAIGWTSDPSEESTKSDGG